MYSVYFEYFSHFNNGTYLIQLKYIFGHLHVYCQYCQNVIKENCVLLKTTHYRAWNSIFGICIMLQWPSMYHHLLFCICYDMRVGLDNIPVTFLAFQSGSQVLTRGFKGLSHWRRCHRDWSVASTRATRETKKWLALSPRRRLTDVSRQGDNQFARKSRGRHRNVTRRLLSCATSPAVATVGQAASRRSRRNVTATSPQSPWSPAGLGDVAETSPQSWTKLVSVTSPQLRRRGDVCETCWRLGKFSTKKKSNMFEFPATPWRPS